MFVVQPEYFTNTNKELKQAIYVSKKLKLKELNRDIYNDLWGLRYKVVKRKLSKPSACHALKSDGMENIVHRFFSDSS